MSKPRLAGGVKKNPFLCLPYFFWYFILCQEVMNRPLVSNLSGLILKLPIGQVSTAT